jgi:hypothetical protein
MATVTSIQEKANHVGPCKVLAVRVSSVTGYIAIDVRLPDGAETKIILDADSWPGEKPVTKVKPRAKKTPASKSEPA